MDIFSLFARLTLDKSDYEKGIASAGESAQGFGAKLKKGLGVASAAATAVIGAASAAAGVVAKEVGQVASLGDNIDKASQKLGISAEAYQEWDAILQHSGTSIDSMGIGMKTLATQANKDSEAFKKLGITQAAAMSREDLFDATITGLQNVADENERAALAQELFGRSAMELGPLLNTSAADTEAMRKRVHELGGVMSNEAVKASAAYQDSLQDMTTAFDGAKRNLLTEFLPAITTVMDGVTEMFTGGDGIALINEGISDFVGKLSDMIPRVLEKGTQIVLSLTDAIVSNLPMLLDAATKAIIMLGTGLIQQLPTIVEAGLQVILSLAQGIADSLPELIPTVVEVVLKIVDILTQPDTLSALVEAAIEIIAALAEGIFKAVPKLYEKIPDIVINIVNAIITSLPKIVEAGGRIVIAWATGMVNTVGTIINAVGKIGEAIWDGFKGIIDGAVQWGKDLIDNFGKGISNAWNGLKNTVGNVAAGIGRLIGFSEPEEGPLSDFHTYAPDMMALFAKGITDNKHLITDAIGKSFNIAPQIGAAQTPRAGAGETLVPRGGASARPVQIVLQIKDTEIGRVLLPILQNEERRYGVTVATGGVY